LSKSKKQARIISASRRTDIPAFYAKWFINRIRAGFCTVPNPFNRKQVSVVSLKPEDVDVIVFWTRNPRPLMPYLSELDERGFRYYFQFTILNYPRQLDPKSPSLDVAVQTFTDLAKQVGSDKVIWRYDPIVFTPITTPEFHRENYAHIAERLAGKTSRSVISIVDAYKKAQKRMDDLARKGAPSEEWDEERFGELIMSLAQTAAKHGMEIVSCAEEIDLTGYEVTKGKCVDNDFIKKVFDLDVSHTKDPTQRKACGCVVSKDIGMYDTCLFGCQYCYATQSFERAKQHFQEHNPDSPSLVGWYGNRSGGSEPFQITVCLTLKSLTGHVGSNGFFCLPPPEVVFSKRNRAAVRESPLECVQLCCRFGKCSLTGSVGGRHKRPKAVVERHAIQIRFPVCTSLLSRGNPVGKHGA
jgi:hypothetical protein